MRPARSVALGREWLQELCQTPGWDGADCPRRFGANKNGPGKVPSTTQATSGRISPSFGSVDPNVAMFGQT